MASDVLSQDPEQFGLSDAECLHVAIGDRVGERYSAFALGMFCVATAAIFHLNFADHAERTLFLKDLAIAGGLFALATSWPIGCYLDDATLSEPRHATLTGTS